MPMKHRLNNITETIAQEEARLARLDIERQAILDRLHDLRQQLTANDKVPFPAQKNSTLSSSAKIALFRSLFKGREDVYPKLWISKNGDRKGYMPACNNDGSYTLCGKRRIPRIKCGDCDQQAYIPVSDEVIRDHLQGKQTVGVYPMLPDDTCRFLAVDFDKSTWREDVAAFRETCSSLDLPVAVERSRSGNGAHVLGFLYGAGHGLGRPGHGLLPDHRNHVPTSSAQHGILTIGFFPARTPCPVVVSAT